MNEGSTVLRLQTTEVRRPDPAKEGAHLHPAVVAGTAREIAVQIGLAFPTSFIRVWIESGAPDGPIAVRVEDITTDDERRFCRPLVMRLAGQHDGWTVDELVRSGPILVPTQDV